MNELRPKTWKLTEGSMLEPSIAAGAVYVSYADYNQLLAANREQKAEIDRLKQHLTAVQHIAVKLQEQRDELASVGEKPEDAWNGDTTQDHAMKALRAAISSAKAAEGVESGTKVFLIRGMQKKPAFIVQTRTAHCIDGRWYWSDGTAVDGSAMRWEAKEKAPEGT